MRAGRRRDAFGLRAALNHLRRPLCVLAALVSTAVAAQGTAPEQGAQPAGDAPSSAAAPARTPPPLEGYRRFDPDEPLRHWRAANAEAARLGGHVGQLGSATGTTPPAQQQPAPQQPAPEQAAPQQPAPHHHDHGAHR